MSRQIFKTILATIAGALFSVACGGGNLLDTTSTTTGTTTTPTTGVAATPVPKLGILTGTTFTPGSISVSVAPPAFLPFSGSSGLRVDIVDTANGNTPITTSTIVSFSSACKSGNTATIANVTTTTGSAAGTYQDKGCGSTDTITATATVNGTVLTATGTINVTPSPIGSITFVSASPTKIGVRGLGNEQSVVTFLVRNQSNGPQNNQLVTFTLDTPLGGTTISSNSGTTGPDGLVSTTVTSGTQGTTVSVTASATLAGKTVTNSSLGPVISTFVPTQFRTSLTAVSLNPGGLGCDGVTDLLTIRVADRFSNDVPDGTLVKFLSETGKVSDSCATVNSACTATWTSQGTRPLSYCGNAVACADDVNANQRPGRNTILAFVIGEESFFDKNNNGVYDGPATDQFPTGFDLPDPFLDRNEDGMFNGDDEFRNLKGNSSFSSADSKFTGLLCAGGSLNCSVATSVFVRDSIVLAESSTSPDLRNNTGTGHMADIAASGATYDPLSQNFSAGLDAVFNASFVIRDINFQPLPVGTTIALTAGGKAPATVTAPSSRTVLNTNDSTAAANTFSFNLQMPATPGGNGTLTLTVTAPSVCGTLITSYNFSTTAP